MIHAPHVAEDRRDLPLGVFKADRRLAACALRDARAPIAGRVQLPFISCVRLTHLYCGAGTITGLPERMQASAR